MLQQLTKKLLNRSRASQEEEVPSDTKRYIASKAINLSPNSSDNPPSAPSAEISYGVLESKDINVKVSIVD
ncbi:hypothetical protein SK128_025256 [Halocaridina rubra]|uniref:Uncharacterized protein n=1 Tax=Halocaridina rubra TaxID=373956 RepID=A0AAN8WQE9_HALRR